MKILTALSLFIVAVCLSANIQAATKSTYAMPFKVKTTADDVHVLKVTRQGMVEVLSYMKSRPDIFPPAKINSKQLLTRSQKQIAWQTWQTFLDQILVLDSLGGKQSRNYNEFKGAEKKQAFFLAYAAFLAQYRYAMDFIALAENSPALHVVLNESVSEIGLPEGSYAKLKFRFLNVLRGAEFVRLNVLYKYYFKEKQVPLEEEISADSNAIWKAGQGQGPKMTTENAFQIVKDKGFTVWYPVQKQVSEWMGNTKIWRSGKTLISDSQLAEMKTILEPGDILLERREWYLSNIGMPGFWPHVALYIGTPEQRRDYFKDPDVKQWLKEQGHAITLFEEHLHNTYPAAYQLSVADQGKGQRIRVIEAKAEGVIFTTLKYSAGADSVAALRPRLSKIAKARAILRAFHYSGRPYDFNFDFLTDAKLVCTELVYKAYERSKDMLGLMLPVTTILGRSVTPANFFAKLFDEEYGSAGQQFDFVLFLDGDERLQKALEADVNSFRQSWQRPKWHIIVKDTPFEQDPG